MRLLPPTAQLTWIARCVWRLKQQYVQQAAPPDRATPLTYREYVTLVGYVLAEHRED